MDHEDAPQSGVVALEDKIPDFHLCFLFGEAVEIDKILDGELAPLQPLYELGTETLDGTLNIFITVGYVEFRLPADQFREVGHGLQFVIGGRVGGPDIDFR